ncbi:hypothetical protein B0F90DRAFT_1695669 [Multifurca ochricompacta]|uniref:SUZ domain-containing protein n=1 Tax=Multifurca ochricompacta TaxID=376703 RepID=A0AAD4M9Q3_9AGAM|nr:hypothetical protein B0F90DRAFT_1695669 [Multifurca ochricompacta]
MSSVISSPPVADSQAPSPFPASSPTPAETDNKVDSTIEADQSIIEALKSKERLFVLRVGEDMERLINERKGRVEIPTATSYQRLLVHRCSAYYKVTPDSDSGSKSIWISFSPESRIPTKRFSELVPVEQAKQPAIKIMSRSAQDRIRAQSQSRTGSVNGEDAESSDVEPSEAGSLGGRSSGPTRLKKALTLEEREAAYNEARSRIFMDFEEKAKEKENDMSASSSTFSLVSGSASTSGGGSSSAGDIDDSISTAPTESEFSGPVARDSKNERRNGSGANSAGSSRSMLPPKHTHTSSCRNSRAPSPSFTYASIYEPASTTVPYDAGQAAPMQPPYAQQFMYPYSPPPVQAPGQNFMPPLPYYSYGYSHPPPPPPTQHHASNSDPSGSTTDQNPRLFMPPPHHPQQMMYMAPYPWAPNPTAGAPSASHSGTPSLPHPHSSQYPFAPAPAPQYGGYNIPTYFPTMNPMHAPAQGQQPLQQPGHPVGVVQLPQGNDLGIRVMPPITMINDHVDLRGRKRGNSRNGGGSLSYGPGSGYQFGYRSNASPVGPRFNSTMRRTSGTSNGSRTPGDEASSVTSSTSSSSRTTSSQHPLPPRPDWAVGLKPNPTLHPTRPPARNGGPRNHTASAPAVLLQPADFPPLGGARAPPVPSGVWTSGAGKAREPGAGAHRDGGGSAATPFTGIGGDGVERTPSKGQGLASGSRAPRLASAPPLGPAHVLSDDGYVQDMIDSVNSIALSK